VRERERERAKLYRHEIDVSIGTAPTAMDITNHHKNEKGNEGKQKERKK
jgi:hypothetical protein